jgi:hypothetical protein
MVERKEETMEGILSKEKDGQVLEGKWHSVKGPKVLSLLLTHQYVLHI